MKYKKKEIKKRESYYLDGIYFDSGSINGNIEINISDKNGNKLFPLYKPNLVNERGFIPLKKVTNNVGELLAFVYALEYSKLINNKKVYGDSNLVIELWSKGYYRKKSNLPEKTIKLIKLSKIIRKNFIKNGGEIKWLPGKYNPADLGKHNKQLKHLKKKWIKK